MRSTLLLLAVLALAAAAWFAFGAAPEPRGDGGEAAGDASRAREAFEALVASGRVPGLEVPRGAWVPAPAFVEAPPRLLVERHRDLLLAEVVAHARRTSVDLPEPDLSALGRIRQAAALALLGWHPSEAECVRLREVLRAGGIWQPWRVALVLGATGEARWYPDVRALLDDAAFGYEAAQAALALGMVGHPAGAERLEAFLRANYGARGYDHGKEALLRLARASAEAREAVTRVAFSLLRRHPSGLRTDGGVQWHEDHPGRVLYIQTTAIEILRKVGVAKDADRLEREAGRLVNPSPRLLDYVKTSIQTMRARA